MASSRLVEQILNILEKNNILDNKQVLDIKAQEIQFLNDLKRELFSSYRLKPDDILLAMSEHTNVPVISLKEFKPDETIVTLLSPTLLVDNKIFPIAITPQTITIATSDPTNIMIQQRIKNETGLTVHYVAVDEGDIDELLKSLESEKQKQLDDIIKETEGVDIEIKGDGDSVDIAEALDNDEAPVIRIVNMILVEALRKGVSDIHIEPFENELRLRYRIDGVLTSSGNPPKSLQDGIISRIKIMSSLDISEKRIPQDGKFRIVAEGKEVDLRVAIAPTVHGEKIVMRILDKGNLRAGLDDLGLHPEDLQKLKLAVANPHGLILVTGPTGSGKTTTLYSCLQELNKVENNIITVENPVEYQCYGINQIEINDKVGMTFAAALRSILRLDPDIVLVGETRDAETAEIAVKAAMTGHLVMTTLHTNSAPGAISRLGQMGIEPFLLASSVVLAQAQRLVRTICPNCKEECDAPTDEDYKLNNIPKEMFEGVTFYKGRGCPACAGSGYKGRASIMEILMITPKIREMILDEADTDQIAAFAVEEQDFKDLRMAGLRRVVEGITTIEEVLRVSAADH
jgi:type IV pilus assembly protein PilB